jgi:hypothetical protein
VQRLTARRLLASLTSVQRLCNGFPGRLPILLDPLHPFLHPLPTCLNIPRGGRELRMPQEFRDIRQGHPAFVEARRGFSPKVVDTEPSILARRHVRRQAVFTDFIFLPVSVPNTKASGANSRPAGS